MDVEEFWAMVDLARQVADGEVDDQVELLREWLGERSDADVAAFHEHLVAASGAIYTWAHAAAGEIPLGGLSDDAFLDFRLWVVAQGREAHDRFRSDPDSLADLDEPWEAEMLGTVASDVLEERGEDTDGLSSEFPDGPPAGDREEWGDAAAVRARYPRLAARYA